jgi:hypothetical protein
MFSQDAGVSGCNQETSQQRNADVRRMVELEIAQSRGVGLSPAQAQELKDLRDLEKQRRRRDDN